MDPTKKSGNFSNLPFLSYQVLAFFLQIFILFVCIEFAQIIYNNDILPDKLVKENFPETTCTIVSKNLSEKGKMVLRYRADFLVSYAVNGNPYRAWVTGNGLDQAFFHEREPQENALAQFAVGQAYPCWYNPQIPQIAVLVMRHNWTSTLPLAVPALIGLIALYFILKSIFQFLGTLVSVSQNGPRYKK